MNPPEFITLKDEDVEITFIYHPGFDVEKPKEINYADAYLLIVDITKEDEEETKD